MAADTTTLPGDLARHARTGVDLLAHVIAVAEDGAPILDPHAPDACENPH